MHRKFILLLILIPLLKPYQVRDGDPGGFEPPTARFVAEYSIQLATDASGNLLYCRFFDTATKAYQVRDGASGRITRLAARPSAVAKATLSSLVPAVITATSSYLHR